MSSTEKGLIAIVGIGPGTPEWMIPQAFQAVKDADVVCGYSTYIDLVKPALDTSQKILSTGMTREIERCRMAIDEALKGKKVALVCSGDPGIYGLSGLVLQLLKEEAIQGHKNEIEVQVIPGISALNACASILGAPLVHDFAVISLSDLLTPWSLIEKRLHAAGKADFVTVIYNPRSKKRKDHLTRAAEILLSYRSSNTPVGIVVRAMRKGQRKSVTTLKALSLDQYNELEIDMQTTLIIGNSQSFVWQDKIITPRGYEV